MKRDVLDAVRRAQREKRAAVLLTNLRSHIQEFSYLSDLEEIQPQNHERILAAVRADRSGTIDTDDGPLFVQVLNPPLRMIVVGAVHIAQALAPIAAMTGYDVTIVDPRRAFASDHRFPDLKVRTDWPDQALLELGPDHRTAVVALTHDPKLDDPALSEALRSPCFYVGALGSTKTHGARLERLRENGFDEDELARICGPVGLNIGARTPSEIAIAIMAQVTEQLRRGPSP